MTERLDDIGDPQDFLRGVADLVNEVDLPEGERHIEFSTGRHTFITIKSVLKEDLGHANYPLLCSETINEVHNKFLSTPIPEDESISSVELDLSADEVDRISMILKVWMRQMGDKEEIFEDALVNLNVDFQMFGGEMVPQYEDYVRQGIEPVEEVNDPEEVVHVLPVRLKDSLFVANFLSIVEDRHMEENGSDSIPRISEKIIEANALGGGSKWISVELTATEIDHIRWLMEQEAKTKKTLFIDRKNAKPRAREVTEMLDDGLRREDIRNTESTVLRIAKAMMHLLKPKPGDVPW